MSQQQCAAACGRMLMRAKKIYHLTVAPSHCSVTVYRQIALEADYDSKPTNSVIS
jgi:hypothetical protein